MFELTKAELENWRCQFGTTNGEKKGLRYGAQRTCPPIFVEELTGVANFTLT
jgi:hypothetical protein